ncbi:MAG: hypothetical protein KatS3mg034_0634 [Vicingaceae bacterium]|nr:MAG: hypothetical protein KatS3mg034_0634 [Vicingaceae bacterium]
MKNQTSFQFSSGNLILFFLKWKKPLIVVTLTAAIVSAIVSLLIEEKYRSTVIVFPTGTNSLSKALLDENYGSKVDILEFGAEENAEQLLQILHSDEIRDKIIQKYDLLNHYEIDPDDKYKMTKLYKKFDDLVSFKRTEFMSVRIDVLDKSPDTAAMIANDIAALLDTVKNRMRKDIAKQALKIVEDRYFNQLNLVRALEDTLSMLRNKGIHDYAAQVEVLTDQLGSAIVAGKTGAVKEIEAKLDTLAKYGSKYVAIVDRLEYEYKELSKLHQKYEDAKIDANKDIESKFVVNYARPSEKKAYPIRWLIVVVSTMAAFLFTLFVIVIWESIQHAKSNKQ